MNTRYVVLALVSIAALGAGWVAYDDDYGRPAQAVERKAELHTLLPPSMPDFAATFSLCHGPIRVDCVVDGDTFWLKGEKIRIADIDAPEIFEPHCPDEK